MKNILFTIAGLLLLNSSFAQNARFTTSATVEFEKRSNMFTILQKQMSNPANTSSITTQLFDQYKKTQPQFKVLKSTLKFADNKSLYTPAPAAPVAPNNYFSSPMADQSGATYIDFATNTATRQKILFEETFLVKDTLRKIKWKITDETRDIAGYPCRRANGLVLDSIYVIAFYTDQIPLSGGPESFTGLPGMILSLILRDEHIRWDAIKVTDTSVPATEIVPPKKGKAVTNKQLLETLQPLMKNVNTAYTQPYLKSLAL